MLNGSGMTRAIVLSLLLALTACDIINAATQEKPNSEQQNAIGDTFQQVGTLAGVADDPASASSDDLATSLELTHFTRLLRPDLGGKPLPGPPPSGKPAPVPTCITANEDGSRTFTACETFFNGAQCQVNGSVTREPGTGGNGYRGQLVSSGDGCPVISVNVDVFLEGPSDMPTLARGTLNGSVEDGPDTSYVVNVTFAEIAVTGTCTVPSSGSLITNVQGIVDGELVSGEVEFSFHDSPGCGIILKE